MSTKHAIKFACEIISEHFGDNVEKVCQVLVSGGQQTLAEICRNAHLAPSIVRNCLLILTQHNCVQAIRYEVEGGPLSRMQSQTFYVVILNNILHRLRFPKFLLHTRTTFGVDALSVVEGLMEHGRLSVEQMIQRAKDQAGSNPELGSEAEDTTVKAFVQLTHQHYLERCPLPEPLLPPRQVTDAAKKAIKGGYRNRATVVAEGYFMAEEERVIQLTQAGEKDRFRVPACVGTALASDMDAEDLGWNPGPASAIGVGDGPSHSRMGAKRKRGEGVGVAAGDAELSDVLWRVNCSEFLRHFRHRVCTSVVRERFDLTCSVLLSAWLHHCRYEESSVQQHFSSALSLEALSEIVRSSPEGCALTLDRLRTSLQQMAADSAGLLDKSSSLGAPSYIINMCRIVDLAKIKEVEAVVNQRFGAGACRIFRLLQQRKQLEQKQIAELAMLPIQDTREHLYRMLQDGYVTLQEVAKTADHAPTRTFFLWRVHLPSVLRSVLDHTCRAASNLRHRLKFELEQEQEVLLLLERSTGGGRSGAPTVQLTASQRQQLERIRRVAAVLEASLLKLDDVILLFSCF